MGLSVCEEMQLARMAHAAGEESPVSSDDVHLHIASCENCRTQILHLEQIDEMLMRQDLREYDADLWSSIRQSIAPQQSSVGWQPFAIVAVLLAAFKLFEMAVAEIPALIFNIVPLTLTLVLFIVIKENPFRINANIALEK